MLMRTVFAPRLCLVFLAHSFFFLLFLLGPKKEGIQDGDDVLLIIITREIGYTNLHMGDDEWERNANAPHPGDHDRRWSLSTTPIRTPVFRRRSDLNPQETQPLPPVIAGQSHLHSHPHHHQQSQEHQQPRRRAQPPRRHSQSHSSTATNTSHQPYPPHHYWGPPPPPAYYHQPEQQPHPGGQYTTASTHNIAASSSSQQPQHHHHHQQQQQRPYSPIAPQHYSPQQGQHPSLYRQYSYPYSYSSDSFYTPYSAQGQGQGHPTPPRSRNFSPSHPHPHHHPLPPSSTATTTQPPPPPPPPHSYGYHPHYYHSTSPDAAFSPPLYNFEPPRQRVSYDTGTPSPPDAAAAAAAPVGASDVPLTGHPPPYGPIMGVLPPPPPPPEYVYLPDGAGVAAPVPPEVEEEPEEQDLVYQIHEADVLCGRGAPSTYHPGNQFFKDLVTKSQPAYIASRRSDKPQIATQIVKIIRERGGRFLRRTKRPGLGLSGHFAWEDVGDQRAYEKTCQSLRENAPELRRRLQQQELAAISSDSEHLPAVPPRVSDESTKPPPPKRRSPSSSAGGGACGGGSRRDYGDDDEQQQQQHHHHEDDNRMVYESTSPTRLAPEPDRSGRRKRQKPDT